MSPPPRDEPSAIIGLLISGGKSSRMGTDKSALPAPDGRTFEESAADRLRAVCGSVWIVGGSSAQRVGDRRIDDDLSLGGGGPMRGLLTGLIEARRCGFRTALVNPVDTPYLTAADLETLVQCHLDDDAPTLARSDRTEPLIGLYPVAAIDSLRQSMAGGRRSLHRWLQRNGGVCRTVPLPMSACRNINTPQQMPKEQLLQQQLPKQ